MMAPRDSLKNWIAATTLNVASRRCNCGCGRKVDKNLRTVNLGANYLEQAIAGLTAQFKAGDGIWEPAIYENDEWMEFFNAGREYAEYLIAVLHGETLLDQNKLARAGRWWVEAVMRERALESSTYDAQRERLLPPEAAMQLAKIWGAGDQLLATDEFQGILGSDFSPWPGATISSSWKDENRSE